MIVLKQMENGVNREMYGTVSTTALPLAGSIVPPIHSDALSKGHTKLPNHLDRK